MDSTVAVMNSKAGEKVRRRRKTVKTEAEPMWWWLRETNQKVRDDSKRMTKRRLGAGK